MRWVALVVALGVGGLASCRSAALPPIFIVRAERFVIPADVPGYWAFCVESPAMNWERPGEAKVGGWTTCAGTVDQLRDRLNQIRSAGVP